MTAVACWLYIKTIALADSPATTVFVGGASDVTASFNGVSIEADTAINRYTSKGLDTNGPAIAEENCRRKMTDGPYLPTDVLQLRVGGGPPVCIFEGQGQIVDHVAIHVDKVGQVQARRVFGDHGPLPLSRLELSAVTSQSEKLELAGTAVLLALGPALVGGAAVVDRSRRRVPRTRDHRKNRDLRKNTAITRSGVRYAGPTTIDRIALPRPRLASIAAIGFVLLAIPIVILLAGRVNKSAVVLHGATPISTPPVASPRPSPAGTASAQVTYPTPLAQVPQTIQVTGTSHNIASGQQIRVFTINPHDTHLNPQPQSAVVRPDGSWTSQTFVGSAADTGKQFHIIVAITNPNAINLIDAYLAGAHRANNYPGLPQLPAGATQQADITVIRTGPPVASPRPSPAGTASAQVTYPTPRCPGRAAGVWCRDGHGFRGGRQGRQP